MKPANPRILTINGGSSSTAVCRILGLGLKKEN